MSKNYSSLFSPSYRLRCIQAIIAKENRRFKRYYVEPNSHPALRKIYKKMPDIFVLYLPQKKMYEVYTIELFREGIDGYYRQFQVQSLDGLYTSLKIGNRKFWGTSPIERIDRHERLREIDKQQYEKIKENIISGNIARRLEKVGG